MKGRRAMRFTDAQLRHDREEGSLFLPGLIPAEEIDVVRAGVPRLVGENRDAVIAEADGKTVRSVLNAHLYDAIIDNLCRHEAIVGPSMQVVDSSMYIFQSILNV